MASPNRNGQSCAWNRGCNRVGHCQRNRLIELTVKNEGRRRDRAEDCGGGQRVESAMLLDEDLGIRLEGDREDSIDDRLRVGLVEGRIEEPSGETGPVPPPIGGVPSFPTLVRSPLDPEVV